MHATIATIKIMGTSFALPPKVAVSLCYPSQATCTCSKLRHLGSKPHSKTPQLILGKSFKLSLSLLVR